MKSTKMPPQVVVVIAVKASVQDGMGWACPSGPAVPTPLPLLLPARATEQLARSGHAAHPGEGTPGGAKWGRHVRGAHGHTQLEPWEAATHHKMPSSPAVHNRFKPPGGLDQRNP